MVLSDISNSNIDDAITNIIFGYLSNQKYNETAKCFMEEAKLSEKKSSIKNQFAKSLPALEDIIEEYFAHSDTDNNTACDKLYSLWKQLDITLSQLRAISLGKSKNRAFLQTRRNVRGFCYSQGNLNENETLKARSSIPKPFEQRISDGNFDSAKTTQHVENNNSPSLTVTDNADISSLQCNSTFKQKDDRKKSVFDKEYHLDNSENPKNDVLLETPCKENLIASKNLCMYETPQKEIVKNAAILKDFKSPKRKAVHPKRRSSKGEDILSERLSGINQEKNEACNNEVSAKSSKDFAKLVEDLFKTTNLHEKLAENINKVATSSENQPASTEMASFGSNETIINEVVKITTDDPDFSVLFNMLGDLSHIDVEPVKENVSIPKKFQNEPVENKRNDNINEKNYELHPVYNSYPNDVASNVSLKVPEKELVVSTQNSSPKPVNQDVNTLGKTIISCQSNSMDIVRSILQCHDTSPQNNLPSTLIRNEGLAERNPVSIDDNAQVTMPTYTSIKSPIMTVDVLHPIDGGLVLNNGTIVNQDKVISSSKPNIIDVSNNVNYYTLPPFSETFPNITPKKSNELNKTNNISFPLNEGLLKCQDGLTVTQNQHPLFITEVTGVNSSKESILSLPSKNSSPMKTPSKFSQMLERQESYWNLPKVTLPELFPPGNENSFVTQLFSNESSSSLMANLSKFPNENEKLASNALLLLSTSPTKVDESFLSNYQTNQFPNLTFLRTAPKNELLVSDRSSLFDNVNTTTSLSTETKKKRVSRNRGGINKSSMAVRTCYLNFTNTTNTYSSSMPTSKTISTKPIIQARLPNSIIEECEKGSPISLLKDKIKKSKRSLKKSPHRKRKKLKGSKKPKTETSTVNIDENSQSRDSFIPICNSDVDQDKKTPSKKSISLFDEGTPSNISLKDKSSPLPSPTVRIVGDTISPYRQNVGDKSAKSVISKTEEPEVLESKTGSSLDTNLTNCKTETNIKSPIKSDQNKCNDAKNSHSRISSKQKTPTKKSSLNQKKDIHTKPRSSQKRTPKKNIVKLNFKKKKQFDDNFVLEIKKCDSNKRLPCDYGDQANIDNKSNNLLIKSADDLDITVESPSKKTVKSCFENNEKEKNVTLNEQTMSPNHKVNSVFPTLALEKLPDTFSLGRACNKEKVLTISKRETIDNRNSIAEVHETRKNISDKSLHNSSSSINSVEVAKQNGEEKPGGHEEILENNPSNEMKRKLTPEKIEVKKKKKNRSRRSIEALKSMDVDEFLAKFSKDS